MPTLIRISDGSIYLTLINKSYGDKAQPASVSLQLPQSAGPGTWQRMDLAQKDQDVAAKTGVMLGGASIDPQGIWSGQWKTDRRRKFRQPDGSGGARFGDHLAFFSCEVSSAKTD